MATKLRNLQLTSVDLVRSGANQEADICIHKSAGDGDAPETNLFKRFRNWLREAPQEAPVVAPAVQEIPMDDTTFLIYTDALAKSILSIHEDDTLDDSAKAAMVQKSFEQFNDAVEKFIPQQQEPESPMPVTETVAVGQDQILEVEKSDRYDMIVEIDSSKVAKLNIWHDPKTGRFTSGPGGNTGAISHRTMTGGGISVHMKTGKEPKDGYMVAVYTERAEWIKGEDVNVPEKRQAAIQSFLDKNKDVLADPDNYLGTWFDPESGNISLDISRNFSDQAKAIKYASEHNEKAIWDVKNMTSIDTGGTGNNL